MSQAVSKLATGDLASLIPHLGLKPEASAATEGSSRVEDMLAKLEAAGFLIEATRLMAHALPKRETVWWSCMCAGHTAPPDLPEADQKCRRAAEEWVRQQNEKRALCGMGSGAGERVRNAGGVDCCGGILEWRLDVAGGPARRAAAAAFHGNAVAGVIALSAVRGDVTRRDARLHRFLESGRNIAVGGPGRLPPETA